MRVYLDNAASTKLHPLALDVMLPYLTDNFGNPSSIHSFGRKNKAAIEAVRKKIAKLLNAKANEIFFCASGTEANNIALKLSVNDLGVERIITTNIEHKCVLNTVKYLETIGSIELDYVKTNEFGQVDLEDLRGLLDKSSKITLVSLMHVQNELGSVNDIDAISKLCLEFNALFHSDTVQSIGHYKFDLQKTKVHFLAASAHKFNGPLGVGFLYKKEKLSLTPWLHGGGHEKNLRSSTENVAGIVGMGKALELANVNYEKDKKHILKLKESLKEGLLKINNSILFNEALNTTYTILSASFPVLELSDTFFIELDLANIAISTGSACSSGSIQASPVLENLNYSKDFTTIRFSFSHYNTQEEIEYVIDFFKKKLTL